jgi:hypothetical protein
MTLTKKSEGRVREGDVFFDAWDEQTGVVKVRVSQEAIEDYADPRGIKGTLLDKFEAALERILEVVDKRAKRDASGGQAVIVKTRDLNG